TTLLRIRCRHPNTAPQRGDGNSWKMALGNYWYRRCSAVVGDHYGVITTGTCANSRKEFSALHGIWLRCGAQLPFPVPPAFLRFCYQREDFSGFRLLSIV